MSDLSTLTREQTRRVDRMAIDQYGMSGLVLMENAGRGVVDALLEVDPALAGGANSGVSQSDAVSVVILCGRGNNAGDGFVVARHLGIQGIAATVVLLCPPSELAGDARVNYDILVRTKATIFDASPGAAGLPVEPLAERLDRYGRGAAWLVDAMLGTGAVGAPREPFRTAIEWMNRQPARRLAVDVPSGLDCDTGEAPGAAVRADLTCTFVAAKPGLVDPRAAALVGELRVASIGVPPYVIREAARSSG